jgi:cyclopropane fatty-acyl-phospholipid synthase-like methyltransferase
MKALDLGCGEGKNAAYLAARGATVEAWDVSTLALENARKAWPQSPIEWQRRSATGLTRDQPEYDIIIAYGLLHCLPFDEIPSVLESMKAATAIGGYNIVVAFNDRLTISPAAHPGFQPSLRTHNFYVEYYRGWRLDLATDEDLAESHPNNGIPHVHAMTRLLAQRTDSRW